MKVFNRLLAATVLAGTVAMVSPAAAQTTYSNTYSDTIQSFGSGGSTPTYGQVFTAPAGSLLSWTFYNNSSSTAGETFAVASWNGTTVSSANLFSSGTNVAVADPTLAGYYSHTVSGINLALTAGQSYYAYYTTYNTPSPISGITFEGSATSPLGGSFQYSNDAGAPQGAGYGGFSPPDLRYSATFGAVNGAVPETATWAMMIVGFGAVGFAMRRGVRRSEAKFDSKIKRIAAGDIA